MMPSRIICSTSARENHACVMSCSAVSRWGSPATRSPARKTWTRCPVPFATSRQPRVRHRTAVNPVSSVSSLLDRAALARREGAGGELPGAGACRISVLLHEVESVTFHRDDQREVVAVEHRVPTAGAIGVLDLVPPHRHPRVLVGDGRGQGLDHTAESAPSCCDLSNRCSRQCYNRHGGLPGHPFRDAGRGARLLGRHRASSTRPRCVGRRTP